MMYITSDIVVVSPVSLFFTTTSGQGIIRDGGGGVAGGGESRKFGNCQKFPQSHMQRFSKKTEIITDKTSGNEHET